MGSGPTCGGGRTDAAAFDPAFYGKVQILLTRMRGHGFDPQIISGHRTAAEQAECLRQGWSQVPFSFHNAMKDDGTPGALAADIKQRGEPFAPTPRVVAFYKALGDEAKRLGLSWGGDYSKKPPWGPYGLGWDPGHVQAYDNSALGAVRNRTAQITAAVERGDIRGAAQVVARVNVWHALQKPLAPSGPLRHMPLWAPVGFAGSVLLFGLVWAIVARRRAA